MTPHPKSASIIVCTLNRAPSLAETLNSLLRVSIPAGMAVEILVVDNGSSDNTAEVVRRLQTPGSRIRYVLEPRRGIANARNRGLAETVGDVVLFADDDIRVPEDWLRAMCAGLNGGKDAVSAGVTVALHLERAWLTPRHRGMLACPGSVWADAPPEAVDHLITASMAFPRSILLRVPGFDAELERGSDSLFSWQLRAAGFRLGFADVTVEHHFAEDRLKCSSFLAAARKMGCSSAYFAWHWDHKKIRHPRLQAFLFAALRLGHHVFSSVLPGDREGCSDLALNLEQQAAFFRQYSIEARQPPNYPLRGLSKHVRPKS